MELEDMSVEEVSVVDYHDMEKALGIGRFRKAFGVEADALARFTPAIVGTSYEEILEELISMDYADELCVRDGRGWTRKYVRNIGPEELDYMAQCAARDKFKKGFLELKLKDPDTFDDRIVMGFRELDGVIRGNELIIPYAQRHIIPVKADQPWDLMVALYAPD